MTRYTTADLIQQHDEEVRRRREQEEAKLEAELQEDPTALCRHRGHRWRGIENPPTRYCVECGKTEPL